MMYALVSGAAAMACWVVGLFFFRFWKQTSDRLFQIFAFAFWILSVERILPTVLKLSDEPRTFVYLIRLLAFILILVGILVKNRGTKA
ncbi:MAG: DUF5985 family protein [Bdellovibrionota bacterium]